MPGTDRTCKGICYKYKFKVVNGFESNRTGRGPYSQGAKRCGSCLIYIKYDKTICPCCHRKLHVVPRNSKYKKIPERLYQ